MDIAIVIGCQRYEDAQIAPLKYTECDARRFAGAIGEICDLDQDGAYLLSSDPDLRGQIRQPTRNAILRALTPPREIDPPEQLFFYFSGHGIESIRNSEPYLLPTDTILVDIEDSAVPLSTVIQKLRAWQAGTTILFLDVCRAAFGRDKAGLACNVMEKRSMENIRIPGFATFWACSPGESSFECDHPDVKSGVFTYALCNALSASSSCRTIHDVQAFLETDTARICRTYQTPDQRQRPYLVIEPLEAQDRYIASISKLRQRETPLSIVKYVPLAAHEDRPFDNVESTGPLVCGFDFGTSHSTCSVCDKSGETTLIPLQGNRTLLKTTLRFTDDLRYQVGTAGPDGGQLGEYRHFVPNIKRLIGQQKSVSVAGTSFRPEELASLVIRSMREAVEAYFRRPIEYALASAPTRFTVRQCEALLEAFRMAGVKVARLIAEPAAASLVNEGLIVKPWEHDNSSLVLDLGGGTLDVAILEYGEGVCDVKASSGDRLLGGIDYDAALSRYLQTEGLRRMEALGLRPASLNEDVLSHEAERVKKLLGIREETPALVDVETSQGLTTIEIPVSRVAFREIVSGLDQRVRACIDAALQQSRLSARQIDSIVLAGLGAKVFTVRELLSQMFPNTPVDERFQESAVGIGLGIYTGVLKGTKDGVLLLDALPTQIGIKCSRFDDRFCYIQTSRASNTQVFPLLVRDTTIPTKTRAPIRIEGARDEQAIVILDVVEEGAHVTAEEATLASIPLPKVAFGDRVELIADVDVNRTIVLAAFGIRHINSVRFVAPISQIRRRDDLKLGVRIAGDETSTVFRFGQGHLGVLTGPGGRDLEIDFAKVAPAFIQVQIYEGGYTQSQTLCTLDLDTHGMLRMAFAVDHVRLVNEHISGVVKVFHRDQIADVQLNNTFLDSPWRGAESAEIRPAAKS